LFTNEEFWRRNNAIEKRRLYSQVQQIGDISDDTREEVSGWILTTSTFDARKLSKPKMIIFITRHLKGHFYHENNEREELLYGDQIIPLIIMSANGHCYITNVKADMHLILWEACEFLRSNHIACGMKIPGVSDFQYDFKRQRYTCGKIKRENWPLIQFQYYTPQGY
jgi:hypothetical protein